MKKQELEEKLIKYKSNHTQLIKKVFELRDARAKCDKTNSIHIVDIEMNDRIRIYIHIIPINDKNKIELFLREKIIRLGSDKTKNLDVRQLETYYNLLMKKKLT